MQTSEATLIEYKLSPSLTIDSVESLADALKSQLVENKHNTSVTIEASDVEVITTPGLQMVVALGKILERHNGQLEIIHPTEVFVKAFETLGLSHLLQKWSAHND